MPSDARRSSLARPWKRVRAIARAAREGDREAFWLIALSALPYVGLIWRHEFLPMQDLTGHVELSFLHDRLIHRDPAYTDNFQISPQPWPNSLSTLVLSLFGSALGFERGVKVLLSVYALAWPLSLGLLARSLGRSPALALFALPTILDFNWALGFFNYLLAKPLLIGSVCVAIAFSRRPTLLRGAALFAMVGLSFLGHGLAYILSGLWCGLSVLFFSRGRFRLINQWPLVLALLYPLRYVLVQRQAEEVPGIWSFGTLHFMFSTFWQHLGDLNPRDAEEYAYALSFGAWLYTFTVQPRPEASPGDAHTRNSALFLFTSALVLFGAYARGPMFMPNVDLVSVRVLVFAYAMVLLLPVAMPKDWTRFILTFALMASVAIHVVGTDRQYRRFNEVEMNGFSELIDKIPPGKGLLVSYYRKSSPFARESAMWHWPKLYVVRKGRGGRTDDTFAWRTTSYVTLSEKARKANLHQRPPVADTEWYSHWDYELVHGIPKAVAVAQRADFFELIESRAEWHLFRTLPPTP